MQCSKLGARVAMIYSTIFVGTRLVQSNCATIDPLIQRHREGGAVTSDLIWLSAMQMRRIEPYFPRRKHDAEAENRRCGDEDDRS
jgi:hypothetical protein